MQQNDISITIAPDAETAILAKIDELAELIKPFAKSLTDEERAAYFKLGDGRLAFDEKCDDYMHQHGTLVPGTIDVAEYDKDGAASDALKRILAKLTPVATLLTDTLTIVGADRLDADLSFYGYLEYAAANGVPGAGDIHAELKKSYPNGRRRNTPPPATGSKP